MHMAKVSSVMVDVGLSITSIYMVKSILKSDTSEGRSICRFALFPEVSSDIDTGYTLKCLTRDYKFLALAPLLLWGEGARSGGVDSRRDLLAARDLRKDEAGERGPQERAGNEVASELLEGDGALDAAESEAPVVGIGEQPRQAEVDELVPGRAIEGFGRSFGETLDGPACFAELGHRGLKGLLVGVEVEIHDGALVACERRSEGRGDQPSSPSKWASRCLKLEVAPDRLRSRTKLNSSFSKRRFVANA